MKLTNIQKVCHSPPCRLAMLWVLYVAVGYFAIGPLMLLTWFGVAVAAKVMT